jgi:FAD/FMN-containing dehydrogenase
VNAPSWLGELRAGLARAPTEPSGYGDFGAGPQAPPRALVETHSLDEVRRVLDVAVRHRIPVAVRGAGHTSGGHTAAPGGIVLRHCPPDAQLRWRGDAIDVPGHWPWGRVEAALLASARALRVTTSCVQTTVAGTLSVGGFGARSVRFGPQVDQVRELALICANGERLSCSPAEHAEHFFSALTGLGQVGIIERVVLETTPRAEHLTSVSVRHPSFAALAASVAWLADAEAPGPDYFCALAKDGLIESFGATCHALGRDAEQTPSWQSSCPWHAAERRILHVDDFERDHRNMPLELWRGCRHVWSDYCFEWPAFSHFAQFVDSELGHTLRGHLAYVLCSAPRTGPAHALDMRPAARSRLFSLGLFYSVPAADRLGIEQAVRAHASALDACRTLGGRPYVYGVWGGRAGLDRPELERFFGRGYAQLRAIRARVDPFGILNPNALG